MNKAEEQYLYNMGRDIAKAEIMRWGWTNKNAHRHSLPTYLK